MRRSTHSRYNYDIVHGAHASTPTWLEMCSAITIACCHVGSHLRAVQFCEECQFRECVDRRIRDTNCDIVEGAQVSMFIDVQ